MSDELPADLDVTRHQGEYHFPDPMRRRTLGILYLVTAGLAFGGFALWGGGGVAVAATAIAVIGFWHLATAWPLRRDEVDALAAASRTVGFPVGHASAQLAFRGLRSRPTWRILLYSADEPPSKRGLVQIDAVDGEILGQYTEDNPEDWTVYSPN